MTLFLALALLLIGAAVAAVVVPLFRHRDAQAPVAAVVTALALPAAALLLYASITSYPWRGGLPPPATGGGVTEAPATPPVDLQALEARTRGNPQDADAWIALGEGYVESDRFADALGAYTKADQLAGGRNMDAQLGMAEARLLQDRDSALREPGDVVERIVAANPDSPKALWYGGIVAVARNDAAAARSRWQRLLDMGPPQPMRHVLEQQLAQLGGGAGTPPPLPQAAAAGPPAAAPAGNAAVRIPLEVSVAEELKARLRADAALFVIARDPGRPGPPVAVVRRTAGELPLAVALTDANVMVPGQSLADLAQVKITARVSASGNPMPAEGDVYGEATWSPGTAAPLRIRLDKVFGTP